MPTDDLKIFGPSGCISREAMLAWEEGRISEEDRRRIRQHTTECAFCHQALEGLSFRKSENLAATFSALDKSFDKRIETNKPKHGSRRIAYFSVAAAACLLAVVGIITLLRYLNSDKQLLVAGHSESQILLSRKDTLADLPGATAAKAAVKSQPAPQPKNSSVSGPNSSSSVTETAGVPGAPPAIKAEEEVAEQKEAKPVLSEKDNADFKMESSEAVAPSAEGIISKKKEVAYNVGERKMAAPAVAGQRSMRGTDDTEFYIVDQPPRFQGGDVQRFTDYVSKEYQKLGPAQKLEIVENLILTFTISSDGKLMNAHIIKKTEPALDSTIMDIVRKAPDWEPGKQNGKPVKVRLNVTINLNR